MAPWSSAPQKPTPGSNAEIDTTDPFASKDDDRDPFATPSFGDKSEDPFADDLEHEPSGEVNPPSRATPRQNPLRPPGLPPPNSTPQMAQPTQVPTHVP
jgi:hypothetical protein